MGYWWRNNCQIEIDATNVTYEETCRFCEEDVEWIDEEEY